MSATIGHGSAPEYRFDWDDDESRLTSEISVPDSIDWGDIDWSELPFSRSQAPESLNKSEIVETLASIARDDDECDVTLVGFE